MGFLFNVSAFIAGWLALLVLAISMAAALYLACDIAEEYASITKRWLHRGTICIIVVYIILFFDGLPMKNVCIGIGAHISYLTLLRNFPFVEPISVTAIWCVFVSIGNHLSWFYFFVAEYRLHSLGNNNITGIQIIGFLFVFVWIIPTGFFISLSSIEDSLPFSAGHGLQSQGGMGNTKKGAIFKKFIDSKKNQLFGTDKIC